MRRTGGNGNLKNCYSALPGAEIPREKIDEVARVVRPGGRFVIFVNHPLFQTPGSGWVDDPVLDPPEQYWRIGPYLPEAETVEEVEKGVHIRFLHRQLARYVNALGVQDLSGTDWGRERCVVP